MGVELRLHPTRCRIFANEEGTLSLGFQRFAPVAPPALET